MPINDRWSSDSRERFWLEITDRDELGVNLHAPQIDDAGKEYWSYELVRWVRPGDVVFHWWKIAEGGPAVVGYSRAIGVAAQDEIEWQAHGTVGRSRAGATWRPSWLLPLDDYADLPQPVTQEAWRSHEAGVRAVKTRLEAAYDGALYFPFAISNKRPLRAAQGYLTKFPAGLVEEMPQLRAVFAEVDLGERSAEPGRRDRRPSGAGWMRDAEARRAIELHAVGWAMEYLAQLGYEVESVGDWFSYDVRARRGAEELHVEVKGSTGAATTIELTANEVAEDEGTERLLVVLDLVECERVSGRINVRGGRPRVWRDWRPEIEHLTITRFRYTLPTDSQALA